MKSKVLIIRFSSIGDIVLTSPVVRCLKLQTGAEIHYLTKNGFRSIVATNPHISKVYTIEKRVGEVLPDLRKENYDYIIDLHNNLRTFLIKWSMPFVKSYSFKKLNFEKWLLVNFKINRLPDRHIVDRYLEAVRPLGVVNDGAGLDFFLGNDMSDFQNLTYLKSKFLPLTPSRRGERFIGSIGKNDGNEPYGRHDFVSKDNSEKSYIAFPIGAGLNTKALTVEKIIKICQSIDYPIILLGGKQEVEKGRLIEKGLMKKEGGTFKVPPALTNLVGKCSLLESAAIVKNAKVVLTGDTGLMHIAAAFRKPIVSVWGNTVPEFGMTPYYPKGMDLNRTFEVENLSCRPCSKIGFEECPKGHFKCIHNLNDSLIVENVKSRFTAL